MQTKLLDTFGPALVPPALSGNTDIEFQNASFSWAESDGTATPSGRRFFLRIDEKLVWFESGHWANWVRKNGVFALSVG